VQPTISELGEASELWNSTIRSKSDSGTTTKQFGGQICDIAAGNINNGRRRRASTTLLDLRLGRDAEAMPVAFRSAIKTALSMIYNKLQW
jgi:hypothetical protein